MWSFWQKFDSDGVSLEWLQLKVENFFHGILCNNAVGRPQDDENIVSKTPCVLGLSMLPSLFPSTKIIFLVRDGRNLAYSLEKSFDVGFFSALMRWQLGVNRILDFKKDCPKYFRDNCLLVRYEDLFSAPDIELRRVFLFLGVECKAYDFGYSRNSDVIGSSELRRHSSKIHWSKVPREKNFSPNSRYESWPQWKQKVAAATLCRELMLFDYLQCPQSTGAIGALGRIAFLIYKVIKKLSIASLRRRFKEWWLSCV